MTPISKIMPNPDQPRKRFDPDTLDDLAQSIREHGLIQPIVVEKAGDGYLIVDGERRWRAAQLAGLTDIPTVIHPSTNGDGAERFVLAIVANMQRDDLSPSEQARAFKRLLDIGFTHTKIAMKCGVSIALVSSRLKLLELDDEIQSLIDDGRLVKDNNAVEAFLSIPDSQTRIALAKRLAEHRASSKVVVESVKRVLEKIRDQNIPAGATPAMRLAFKHSGEPDRTQWDALAQVGRVPPWLLVEISTREVCDGCPLRNQASTITCKGCGLVELLSIMIGKVNNGHR